MKKFLLTLCSFAIIGVLLILYAKFIEPKMLVTNNISVNSNNEMKLAVFGDTHFGKDYNQENIEKIVKKINENDPDVVVFTGDFFDDYQRDFKNIDLDYLKEWLSLIKGTKIAVRGNHDIGGGIEFLYEDFMTQSGFNVLINEEIYIKELSLNIFGYDDSLLGQINKDFFNQDNDNYNLFVMHEPDSAELLTGTAKGMVLSGHSHGGQIYIPFLTEKILPPGATKYFRGLYKSNETGLKDDVFVTTGVGTTVIPMRFLTVPEIAIINFTKN